MENSLETAQNAWDKLVEEGTLTEEMQKTFPRPETTEDVAKLLSYGGWGGGLGWMLFSFLLGSMFSPWNSCSTLEKLLSEEKIDK